MNTTIVSALAALVGAAIGGLTSVLASWLTQRSEMKAQWILQLTVRRRELYRDFIDEASKAYVHAMQHGEPDISILVGLFAKIDQMRVISTMPVVENAQSVGQKIVDTYLSPDRSFVEMRAMLKDGSLYLLTGFSEACRTEFERLQNQQF